MTNLEEIAEHARWLVAEHGRMVRFGIRPRCTICEEWWPCDRAGLAARVVLHAEEVRRLREQVRIAEDTLSHIARCGRAARGPAPRELAHARTLADDALTRMSVVE